MKPKSRITRILNNACKEALHFINPRTASPEKRKNVSATQPMLHNIRGYRILKQPKKNAADLTRIIDAETEAMVFRFLMRELYEKAHTPFVCMSEERGVLSCPYDFDPRTVKSFILILLDPVDNTDLVRTGFGGAVGMAAAKVRIKGKDKTARMLSAEICSSVVGDLTKNEIFWAEAEQEGAYVDFPVGHGQWQTEILEPDHKTDWTEATFACLNTKGKRVTEFFKDQGWMYYKGRSLNMDVARFLFHHGGPVPICRVASGDIHANFDCVKGFKPIDYAPGLFIADKAGCVCHCFDEASKQWRPNRLLPADHADSLETQLFSTLMGRLRFCCTANRSVMDYCTSVFFSKPDAALVSVQKQVRAAEYSLDRTLRLLRDANQHELARIVERIFHLSLPYFVECHSGNPVEHMTFIAEAYAELGIQEGLSDVELKRGVIAALTHDIGQGVDKQMQRIRKTDIPEKSGSEREKKIMAAINFRCAHMKEGARIMRMLLTVYNVRYGETFTPLDIEEICRLIGIHDNPSVQEYQVMSRKVKGQRIWLFDPADRLAALLRMADRMYMLSENGIEVDLARDLAAKGQADPKDRILRNLKRFVEEAELHYQVLGTRAEAYQFKCGLLFRFESAYGKVYELLQKLEKKHGVKTLKLFDIHEEKVEIAGLTTALDDYKKYQCKNHPKTIDLGVTVVMGKPFEPPFLAGLEKLVRKLSHVFAPYESKGVKLTAYAPSHLHATVCPVLRTPFDHKLYLMDPEQVHFMQKKYIQENRPDHALIKNVVNKIKSFDIEVRSGRLSVNGRGEILLWSKADRQQDQEHLSALRESLQSVAHLDVRDKGHGVHITLGTIDNFIALTHKEKEDIANKLSKYLQSAQHRQYLEKSGTARIDRVTLVYYEHRSLSRCSKEIELMTNDE